MTEQHVLVIYCGGTIGMTPSADGFVPARNFADAVQQHLPADQTLPQYTLLELDELIDSANIRCDHWLQLAGILQQNWHDYDGFVILHGTDTMAYSASMLSFLLTQQDKPVVFTGAQIPLSQPGSDGLNNLINSLHVAAYSALPEVVVCFNHRILRGNGCTKVSSTQLDAFQSPNGRELGRVHSGGTELNRERNTTLNAQTRTGLPLQCQLPTLRPEAVAIVRFYPGIQGSVIEMMAANAQAVVLQTYGLGNFPDADSKVVQALQRLQQQDIVVVNTSQCLNGGVQQSTYASGAVLNPLGVVDGQDMTLEAAFTKLHYLLATESRTDNIREKMQQDLRGELTR
ncbi:L-asparaginase 1 [Bacterioplanes sanyensis]|uniref:asparaginase n=1 Tax=Bacterioplanes sanyensis TaxID=1249553 RepID=A0A222FMA6_9GAMM|nr:asparaginase [Bacterioplanes sanyensis]ASP40157.1 L-asparaginase 1 [Bacterioplanes sanyensis]